MRAVLIFVILCCTTLRKDRKQGSHFAISTNFSVKAQSCSRTSDNIVYKRLIIMHQPVIVLSLQPKPFRSCSSSDLLMLHKFSFIVSSYVFVSKTRTTVKEDEQKAHTPIYANVMLTEIKNWGSYQKFNRLRRGP
ncbi:hypothetical protein GQX74_010193 [Glossina fuscipes]|nr:hypothetical protein GQX74_010193 [Glossina fuscipes]